MCSFVYSSSRCSVPVFVQGASAFGVAVFRVVVVAAAIAALGYWLKKKAMKRASNQCNMTFSRPKYVPVPVAGYPGREGGGEGEIVAGENLGYGYRLLRYMDGRLPASDKADPLRPRGIPVVFVPGHLGKYDQVCVFVCCVVVDGRGSKTRRQLLPVRCSFLCRPKHASVAVVVPSLSCRLASCVPAEPKLS